MMDESQPQQPGANEADETLLTTEEEAGVKALTEAVAASITDEQMRTGSQKLLNAIQQKTSPVKETQEAIDKELERNARFVEALLTITKDPSVITWFDQGGEVIELYEHFQTVGWSGEDLTILRLSRNENGNFILTLRGGGTAGNKQYDGTGSYQVVDGSLVAATKMSPINENPVLSSISEQCSLEQLKERVESAIAIKPFKSLDVATQETINELNDQIMTDNSAILTQIILVFRSDFTHKLNGSAESRRSQLVAANRTLMEIEARWEKVDATLKPYLSLNQLQESISDAASIIISYAKALSAEENTVDETVIDAVADSSPTQAADNRTYADIYGSPQPNSQEIKVEKNKPPAQKSLGSRIRNIFR